MTMRLTRRFSFASPQVDAFTSALYGQVMARVGKMRTAVAGLAMLSEAFNNSLVTNRLPGRGISFLLLFTGGTSSSRPCQSS